MDGTTAALQQNGITLWGTSWRRHGKRHTFLAVAGQVVAREDPHLLSPMLSTAAVAFMISSTKLVAHRAVLGVATMVRERDFVNNKAQRIISPARRVVVEAHRTYGSCPQRA